MASPSNSESCERAVASVIADVILATDRRVAAARAEERLVRVGRKFSAFDRVHGREQPLLTCGHGVPEVGGSAERYERILFSKGDVPGAPKRPGSAVPSLQRLLGANAVHRQLQRTAWLWRLAKL